MALPTGLLGLRPRPCGAAVGKALRRSNRYGAAYGRGGVLETRSARLRLAARPRPYWTPSGKPGLHLGYRRLVKTNGSWILRRYQGQPGEYDTKSFAQADDFSGADNSEVLT